jgi:hypothetical protein
VIIDAIERLANSGIGLSKREESLLAQPPQNARLGKTDSVLNFRFLSSPGLQFVWMDKRA